MALFTRIQNYVSGQKIKASEYMAEFDNVINKGSDPTYVEDISANTTDFQATSNPGGVGSENLPTNLKEELKQLRYKISQIIGGAQWYSSSSKSLTALNIVNADINVNANIDGGKLLSASVNGSVKLVDLSVTEGKIAADAVTTTKIPNNAITRAKLVAVGHQVSSSSGTLQTNNTGTPADVTSLTVSITTTGRPVCILLIPDGNATESYIGSVFTTNSTSGFAIAEFYIYRDATLVGQTGCQVYGTNSGASNDVSIHLPPGCLNCFDVPSAGTYTYKVQFASGGGIGQEALVFGCKLVAYEL